jgi:transcriptional regulator with XRE-family HTH domain
MTLREARRRRGLTQEQLEAASGVSQTVISKLERGGSTNPAYGTVVNLADALGVDPRALVFHREAVAS